MININNLSFEFGGNYLYKDISWHIKPKERIGLIGLNGTGKSTLLKLINKTYQPSEGNISMQKDTTIGLLNQDLLSYESDDPIRLVALQAFERQLQLQKEIDQITQQMETDYTDELLEQLSDKQHEFENLDGYQIESKTEEILEGLGFKTNDLGRSLKEFSGGWRMRVMLAKLLLQKPSLLMLDEPTNHLDLPSIEWLETYLQKYEGTVIIISHDRYFLDRMVTKIVELAHSSLFQYSGNYTFYLEAKEERESLRQRQYENQQQFIKDQEKFINRFRAKASKATAVQSRVKMLDKLDRIEVLEDETAGMNLSFRPAKPSGKIVHEFEDISKNYGPIHLLNHTSGIIARGDKIALIGANGKGKSTLLRMIAGTEPHEGKSIEGYNVVRAFYAQHQLESLHLENDILAELQQAATDRTEVELRTVLGCFLFTGEDVFKKIRVLSGGEKARVALAKTLLSEANFMLLDEPTNHLDMRSCNILIQALQQYEGSYVVVSHDRHFISEIANKIWWIEDQELKEYPGTYQEFTAWHELQQAKKQPAKKQEFKVKKQAQPHQDHQQREAKKAAEKELKKLQRSFEQMEAELEQVKTKKADLEHQFTLPDVVDNSQALQDLTKEYEEIKDRLSELNAAYEQVFNRMMELEGNL